MKLCADRGQIQLTFIRSVGDPEATADVNDLRSDAQLVRGAESKVQAAA